MGTGIKADTALSTALINAFRRKKGDAAAAEGLSHAERVLHRMLVSSKVCCCPAGFYVSAWAGSVACPRTGGRRRWQAKCPDFQLIICGP